MTEADILHGWAQFEEPDAAELEGGALSGPPPGWAAARVGGRPVAVVRLTVLRSRFAQEAANSTKDVQVAGETASAGTVRSLESRTWMVWGQVATSMQSPLSSPL